MSIYTLLGIFFSILLFIARKMAMHKETLDGIAIEELKRSGTSIKKVHTIEFFLYFNSEFSAQKISKILHNIDYDTSVRKSNNEYKWLVIASKSMIPKLYRLIKLIAEYLHRCYPKT